MKLVDFDVHYVSVKDDNLERGVQKEGGFDCRRRRRRHDRRGSYQAARPLVAVAFYPLAPPTTSRVRLALPGTPQELVETWKIDKTHPLDVGMVKASWGTSRFLEGFGVGLFAEFLKAADKGEKAKGADNFAKAAHCSKKGQGRKPIELSIKIDGKSFNGEFLGVEVMNVPFTGPGLPLARKADVADGLLDVVCFDAERAAVISKSGLMRRRTSQAPVTTRQGEIIELVWADTANRLDDELHGNRDKKQVAEIACEKDKLKVLIPVKHPSQKAVAK